MANQATIQARVFYGYKKAAQYLGAPFQQFRATSTTNPLTGPALSTLNAAFDQDPKFSFKAPSGYAKAIYFGLFDGTSVQVGDYLVNAAQGTYFVAGYEPIKPMLCVQSNVVASFFRPAADTLPGYTPVYGGRTEASQTSLMTGWPISCLQGTKGENNATSGRLPGDVRTPWWIILMPTYPGVLLRSSDRMEDNLGRAFTISSVEVTDLGYRMTAVQSET
jgi:hypothetical protein